MTRRMAMRPGGGMATSPAGGIGATIIISVCRDVSALRCILTALADQTYGNFEVLVSEDGEDPAIARTVEGFAGGFPWCRHLTQPDCGFRKNRALNRALLVARFDYLIFIDGDCVPHTRFVESHAACVEKRMVCAGRRVMLGPAWSSRLRKDPSVRRMLENPWRYGLLGASLHMGGVRHYDAGFRMPLLHSLRSRCRPNLVGCNFSCFRSDLLEINGFNEDYQAPGIGEDADIGLRLGRLGIKTKCLKFMAILYHLHHHQWYRPSAENEEIFRRTRRTGASQCMNGVSSHAP